MQICNPSFFNRLQTNTSMYHKSYLYGDREILWTLSKINRSGRGGLTSYEGRLQLLSQTFSKNTTASIQNRLHNALVGHIGEVSAKRGCRNYPEGALPRQICLHVFSSMGVLSFVTETGQWHTKRLDSAKRKPCLQA